MKIEKGWILDGFQITPSINWTWMPLSDVSIGEKKHWVQFAFLWWYISFGWVQKGTGYIHVNAVVDKNGNFKWFDK